jgi:hypothetical protein
MDFAALDGGDQKKTFQKHASILVPRSMMSMAWATSQEAGQARFDAALNIQGETLLNWIRRGVMDREVEEGAIYSLAKIIQARMKNKLQFVGDLSVVDVREFFFCSGEGAGEILEPVQTKVSDIDRIRSCIYLCVSCRSSSSATRIIRSKGMDNQTLSSSL